MRAASVAFFRRQQGERGGSPRRRRAPRHFDVYRDDLCGTSGRDKARTEHPAKQSTGPNRHDALRCRHCLVGLPQGDAHRIGDRTGNEQDIGVPRRRRSEEAQPMHVVIRIVELPRFAHAGAAGAGIDETKVQGPAEGSVQFTLGGR